MIENLPEDYHSSIQRLLGDDAPRFFQAMMEVSQSGLRLNPKKNKISSLEKALGVPFQIVPWEENGYSYPIGPGLGKHPFHAAGLYYLQEPSAMAPVGVLDPKPRERILDLCAAPGGKTTQILDRMKGEGYLLANDPNPRRVQALARNIERWGARNIAVVSETPDRLSDHFGEYFDRVLVDAPCSGEGTFRSHPAEIKKWSLKFVYRCASIQDEILWYASKMVRPGGTLVYSTCTFNQEENEVVIERFLSKRPEFSLETIPQKPGFSSGIPLSRQEKVDLSRTVRIWPHLAPGEGHFVALLKKAGDADHLPKLAERQEVETSPDKIEIYRDFFQNTLVRNANTEDLAPENSHLEVFGSQLYSISPDAPSLKGLNVIHWGFWMGNFRSGRFIPSPALASGMNPADIQTVLEFSLDDPQLKSYLRGSPIKIPDGSEKARTWALVCAEGVPIGWGKIQGDRLKSHFPSWLRST